MTSALLGELLADSMVDCANLIFTDFPIFRFPKFPSYSLPYALDIHLPAVSCIFYAPLCPEEFIAYLHSVKSKLMATSSKV